MHQQGVRRSPLRPRSISSELAAVAGQCPQGNESSIFVATSVAVASISEPSVAPPGRAVQQTSVLSGGQSVGCTIGMPCSPRLSDMMFELPENVSRRPLPPKSAYEVDQTYQRAALGTKRGTKRKLSAGVDLWGVKKSRRFLSGFERAAARKRRQHFAKRAVSRRVALWRARIVDGERQTMYVTLGGEALPKSGRAFRLATSEQKYLKSNGIVSNKPQDSAIDRPERLAPYTARSDNPRTLGYYCIPESVEVAYRDAGVRQLYAWQAECLASPGVLDGRSLVYVAPTSAGKSLVAEVIMLRQLLFRGRRALLILPYVSICVEKVAQLRRLWGGCGVRIEALYSNSDGNWHCGADIAVCTIEKASSLLNHLLEEDCLLRDVGTIVIDEMHILGEEHRGYILELILVKARLSARLAAPADPAGALQIIGLSATLPNVNMLAEWLGAHLYVSDSRPVPLSLSVASRGQIMESSSQSSTLSQSGSASLAPRDPDGLVPLVWESIAEGHSVLVFCATKEWCEKAAVLVAEEVLLLEGASVNDTKADARFKTLEELRQLPAGLCPVLAKTILQGVAYHHAGLTVEERAIVEEAFRNGSICCLCATSTLAAGVNLPARRVIIRSMSVGNAPLDATRFKQMAGRAGRAGFDTMGECVVMTRSAKDVDSAKSLFSAQLVEVQSGLRGQRLERAVLEVISLCLVRSMDDLRKIFAPILLRYLEVHERESLMQDLQTAVSHLEELLLVRVDRCPIGNGNSSTEQFAGTSHEGTNGEVLQQVDSNGDASGNDTMLKASLMTTPLGDGVVASSLSPVDALSAFQDLQRARSGLCLDTDLHIVFLATPVNGSTEPDWARFLSMYERLPPRERAACDRIGISHEFLIQEALGRRKALSTSVPGHAGDVRSDRERSIALHRRFWAAFALCELLAEKPLHKVAAAHRIPRGALQALQQQAGTYCTLVKCLCERLRWHEMAAIFEGLRPRLNFGVSVEAAPLCRISGVHAHQARALIDAGYTTVEHVARASNYDVERALNRLRPFESICKDRRLALLQDDVARKAARKIVASAQDLVSADTQNVEDEAEVEERRVMAAIAEAPTAARANGPLPRRDAAQI